MPASQSSNRSTKQLALLSESNARDKILPDNMSGPEPASDPTPAANVGNGRAGSEAVMGEEAAEGEEQLLSEHSQAHSGSGGDRCSSLQQQKDVISDSEVEIEPGLEMETSAEGGTRTPPMRREAAEAQRTGLDLMIVPKSEWTPDWLPAGWTTEVRVRTSGISAGTKDKYFYEPVSHRRFRSKREVLDFLKTGKTARYKSKVKPGQSTAGKTPKMSSPNENTVSQKKAHEADVNNTPFPSSRSCKQDLSGSSSKNKDASTFDYLNRPDKVKWVLSNAAEGSWKPFVGGEEVSDSSKKEWAAAFESLSVGAANFQK